MSRTTGWHKEGVGWNKERVVEKLVLLNEELGHSPTYLEAGNDLAHASVEYFSSWNRAKRSAGLEVYPRAHG